MEQNQRSFEDVRTRLEEIVDEVNAEDISLDDALKLYEEAVKLGLSACELSESDIFPQEEVEEGTESNAADSDAVQVVAESTEGEAGQATASAAEGESITTPETFETDFEASDIAEASAIEHMGDAASVQFPDSAEPVAQTEVEDDGPATYSR